MFLLKRAGRHTRNESLLKRMKKGHDEERWHASTIASASCQSENSIQASHEFYSNSDKMRRATSNDAFTQAWFDYSRSVFPQSVRKTGTNVELFNVPTYQCSILFNNMSSFNRKSEFRRPENLNKPITKFEKFNVADLSLLTESWRKQLRACDSDSRG